MANNYYDDLNKKQTLRLRAVLEDLPAFMKEFFRNMEDTTQTRTRLGYAYDLKIFFDYLFSESESCAGMDAKSFKAEDLARVTVEDLEDFRDYLTYYVKKEADGEGVVSVERQNEALGKSRKLSAVRKLFGYFYKKRKIPSNPSELIEMPRIHEKAKIFLDVDEIARLIDEVESGEGLTDRQKKFHALTRERDVAIITLLLGTGIRISECVGLNIEHINFKSATFLVRRKGGDETILSFGEEVEQALKNYLEVRKEIVAVEGHEDALFLSLHRKRLTDRAIENLVKKYAQQITHLKKITPHKLRGTFATSIYRETGDIYLTAELLGHKDINTTRKHYAEADKDQARRAVRALRLREKETEE